MTDIDRPETFHGLPVLTLPAPGLPRTGPLPAADAVAWLLESAWQGSLTFAALWQHFLDTVDTTHVRARCRPGQWRTGRGGVLGFG